MQRTIVIRRDYLHYVRKYSRFEKRHKNMSVHLSPAFRYVYFYIYILNIWPNFKWCALNHDSLHNTEMLKMTKYYLIKHITNLNFHIQWPYLIFIFSIYFTEMLKLVTSSQSVNADPFQRQFVSMFWRWLKALDRKKASKNSKLLKKHISSKTLNKSN